MVTQSAGGDVFHAVADNTRRAILHRLRGGGQAVNDIARAFPVSRPAISKHLRVLAAARLVVEQREGRRRIYRLNAAPLREVDRWLDQYREFWAAALANLKKHVESKGAKR
jgi:DNA-binding transcriptional ArsR family regulator